MTEKRMNLHILDKNNKEIYSKDTVRFHNSLGKVLYDEKECRFKVFWDDGFSRGLNIHFAKEIEVL